MSGQHRDDTRDPGRTGGWDDEVLRRLGPREVQPDTGPQTGPDTGPEPVAAPAAEPLPASRPREDRSARPAGPEPTARTRRQGGRRRRVAEDGLDDLADGPDGEDPDNLVSPWESRRARRLARRPGTPTWRRRVRVLTGLVRSDDEPERRATATATCQTAVSTGRRVAVVSAHGGAGGTTLAVSLAVVLAGIRNDAVAVLPGDADHGVLRHRLGCDRPTSVREARDLLRARQSDPHNVPLEQFEVPGVDRLRAATEADDATVVAECADHLSRRHALTFVDCGRADDHPVLPACHGILVVGRQSLDGVAQVHDRLVGLVGREGRDRLLVALLDTGTDTGLDLPSATRLLARHGVPVVSVPPDLHLGTGTAVSAALLGPSTTVALTEIAARVLDVVTVRPSSGAGGS